jgi:hypothetical protein
MKTYLLNMYYPSLKEAQHSVRRCQETVNKIAGKNWRMIKSGGNTLSIVFGSDMENSRIQEQFTMVGQEEFSFLIVEISKVVGGWIEPSIYEWIRGRLARD